MLIMLLNLSFIIVCAIRISLVTRCDAFFVTVIMIIFIMLIINVLFNLCSAIIMMISVAWMFLTFITFFATVLLSFVYIILSSFGPFISICLLIIIVTATCFDNVEYHFAVFKPFSIVLLLLHEFFNLVFSLTFLIECMNHSNLYIFYPYLRIFLIL